jgi:ABC-2 type transport system permease protein
VHWRRILAIVRKDLAAVRRSRTVLLPLVLVPLVFFVLMPVAIGLLARFLPIDESDAQDLERLLRALPAAERERFQALHPGQQLAVIFFSYQFAPLILIVPLATTMVIAADGIAGERERRTLEALLVTPVRDEELFLGKVLAAALPASLVDWIGATIAALLAIAVSGIGPPLLPSLSWLILAYLGGPGVAVFGLSIVVLISSRVRGMQEVSQLSGLVAIPLIGLIVAQGSGLFLLDWRLALAGSLVIWGIAALLLRVGRRSFQREALLRLG